MRALESDRPVAGIIRYGAYLPHWRLERAVIASALGRTASRATGGRAVAGFDEDTTSMGVEAARRALRAGWGTSPPDGLWFSTTAPAYADKTNAAAIHAALLLPSNVGAYDVNGAVRSNLSAISIAASRDGLAVLSDMRTGLPGGTDEEAGGDAAAALWFGTGDEVVAEMLSVASETGEFLDRWRAPGSVASEQWEERFAARAYRGMGARVLERALSDAHLGRDELDQVVVVGLSRRATREVYTLLGLEGGHPSDALLDLVGNTGSAHLGIVLADILDRAQPGETIGIVQLADGADAIVLRVTRAIEVRRAEHPVREQIARMSENLLYTDFLRWRGVLPIDPPRRPKPDRPAAPPSLRTSEWKFGFVGTKDSNGAIQLPPSRVALDGGEENKMERAPMADVAGRVATFTIDHLAYSLNPPTVIAVIDFAGGGRFMCELTDLSPEAVRIGDPVEMTFRRMYSVDGVHDYFWKGRPADQKVAAVPAPDDEEGRQDS